MSNYRKVWSVSSGEYSDYGVRCLFESKAEAEAHVATLKADEDEYLSEPRVEEFFLYSGQPAKVDWWTAVGSVPDDGGMPERQESRAHSGWEYDGWSSPPSRPTVRVYRAPAYPGEQRVTVDARSRKTAEKVLSDRLAELLAQLPASQWGLPSGGGEAA